MSTIDIVQDEHIDANHGLIDVLPWVTSDQLRSLKMDGSLGLFWNHRPDKQHRALIEIATVPHGRVVAAVVEPGIIVSYLTFHAPSHLNRRGQALLEGLVELGGIEVSPAWRKLGLARVMLETAFADTYYDEKIVLATGLSWCWDMQGTGLNLNEYRKMLIELVRPFGFTPYDTDDPEILRYPGNGLVARIGPRAPSTLQDAFATLRFAESLIPFSREMARVAN